MKRAVDLYRPLEIDLSHTDMLYLKKSDLTCLCFDAFHRYRELFRLYQNNHPWNVFQDEEFLIRIGSAVKIKKDVYLTKAGILLFGYDYAIRRFFPYYDIHCKYSINLFGMGITERSLSAYDGKWSGCLFDLLLELTSRVSDMYRAANEGALRIQLLKELLGVAVTNIDPTSPIGLFLQVEDDKLSLEFGVPNDFEVSALGTAKVTNPTIGNALACINLARRRGTGIPMVKRILALEGLPKIQIEKPANSQSLKIGISLSKNEKTLQNQPEANEMDGFLASIHHGESFTRKDVVAFLGKSPAMVSIYIKKALEEGKIEVEEGYLNSRYIKK